MGKFKYITTRCAVCGNVFDIGEESFSEVDVVLNGNLAKVTFFSCPHCGDYQVSSVDTMETEEIRLSEVVESLVSECKQQYAMKRVAGSEMLVKK